MKQKSSNKLDKGLVLTAVIALAVLAGFILFMSSLTKGEIRKTKQTVQVLQSGSIAEGLAVKTGDQTSMMDRISGKKSYAVEVYYTVEGTEYHLPKKTTMVTAYKVSSDIFDPIDGEDQDGQGPVTVRYNPEDPQDAAVVEFSKL